MDDAPTLRALVVRVDLALAALVAYLAAHPENPQALAMVRALQWTLAGSVRVALGLRSGVDEEEVVED
jgi:hypothetical protein